MSAKFYTLLTDIGAAKLASAAALGVPLKITQMAVGDGGGVLPTPNAQQTKLVAEKRRADLNMLYIDPQNSSQIIAEQVIPETEGGWWIREVGLFDETGALIAVGNCPESYKPQLAEGSGRTQTVRMVLITSSTDNITLKIDPAVVLATRKYVDDKVLELKVYVDDLMADFATTMTTALAGKMDKAANGADIADIAEFLNNLGLGAGSALPVGVPVPWPLAAAPAGWLKCNGAAFTAAQYPKLAQAYPGLKVPDLRGEFIRGWDDGRGVDSGRALLEWQKGTLVGGRDDNDTGLDISYMSNGATVDYGGDKILSASYQADYLWYMDLGTVTNAQRRTAVLKDGFFNVTRPRNIAFNYIVRAA
ncbi:hypothetical protein NUKP32_07510 [Klebsiella variicola]|uniref:phage tail protein n=1 Tax=Klebsiella variicola TaxID=244366 RepID=UPI0018C33BCA|nr:phage tail protein [Klebsiella variicola]ELC9129370.1 phage tail protein [Klebsiella variicola]MBG0669537.1 phage tail protein [Enterobacter roggenkampii]GKJ44193.1 hypothetical protein NUKP32_07510 [Klebsiella variicola]